MLILHCKELMNKNIFTHINHFSIYPGQDRIKEIRWIYWKRLINTNG